jgi:hypothetical protein
MKKIFISNIFFKEISYVSYIESGHIEIGQEVGTLPIYNLQL